MWNFFSVSIEKSERCFFIFLIIIGMLLTIDYHFLRNLKDTVVVTHVEMGAETIPFIRLWMLFPITVLFTFVYTTLSRYLSQSQLFYLIPSAFCAFFLLFAIYLFPNEDRFALNQLGDYLIHILPSSLAPVAHIIQHWQVSLFFIFSELWGSAILLVLFWGMCNRRTNEAQAKRLYGPLTFFHNLAGLIANYLMMQIVFPDWKLSLQVKILFVVASCIASMAVFFFFNKQYTETTSFKAISNKSERIGFIDSLKYLVQTPYLLGLASVVFSYFFTLGVVEIYWQSKLRELSPQPALFSAYLNQLNIVVGIVSMITSLLVASKFLQVFGWFGTALVTPICLIISATAFFVSQSFQFFSVEVVVLLGAVYIAISRIMKFSFLTFQKK